MAKNEQFGVKIHELAEVTKQEEVGAKILELLVAKKSWREKMEDHIVTREDPKDLPEIKEGANSKGRETGWRGGEERWE